MDLRQLQMLKAVVETGSYAKAGERLWVTHSAIHRQVRLLEEEVKHRILIKSGRRMELTETGQILLSLAQRVEKEVEDAERKIALRSKTLSGTFRIGTSTTTLTFFLPPVLLAFREAHPGVRLHVQTNTAERVKEGVRMRQLDLGIIMGSKLIAAGEHSLLHHPLYEEEFVLAIPKQHPLAVVVERPIVIADLEDAPLIMHARGSHIRKMVDQLFEKAGMIPQVCMELENEETMQLMVGIGLGAAFVSKHRIESHPEITYLSIGEGRVATDVAAIYGDDDYQSPVFREFMRLCHAHAHALREGKAFVPLHASR